MHVSNLEYNIHMTVSRDNTSYYIALLNSAWVDNVICSPPFLSTCNSLAILSFFAIKSETLELVALTYALVASGNGAGFLRTWDTITHYSNCTGDMWTSRVGTLRDCTTLCCDSSKDMLCISASGLYSRISVSPSSLGTFFAHGPGEASGVTSWL